jgi:hypothetical protein
VEQDEASQGGAEEHQTEEQEFVEISHQEEEQQEQGEEIIHHEVQYITEDGEEHHGQYLVEHEQVSLLISVFEPFSCSRHLFWLKKFDGILICLKNNLRHPN